MNNKQFQEALENFIRNEVYVCMSGVVSELLNCSDDFQEVYYEESERHLSNWIEVWSVSDYLAKKLSDEDEFVLYYAGHYLWFREVSGQSISMDGVIQGIYNKIITNVYGG